MNEEMLSQGAYKPRPVLGDVTNLIGKRGFCSVYKKDESIQISKKECVSVDESYNKQIAECVSRPQLFSEINSLTGSVYKVVCEVKEPCVPDVRENDALISSATVKDGDVVRDVCESTQLIATVPSDENRPRVMVEVEEGEIVESNRTVGNDLGMDNGNGVSLDKLDLIKDEFLDCSGLLQSQESRCGLERCIGQKGDGSSSACMDMIKTCSCSFCMKAASLWSDLHCQDIKGHIAAIKKSQKQASILVDRNNMNGARNFGNSSNSESDFTGRWKSLFLHMENVFVREGTQLETSLSTLKNLVDDCKTNSEKN